jgi:hypothetical protein
MTTSASVDLEKLVEPDDLQSLKNSQTSGSLAEVNRPSSLPGKLTTEGDNALSRITSAVYDPASRVPTNATIESGIIGIQRYRMVCID